MPQKSGLTAREIQTENGLALHETVRKREGILAIKH